MLRDSISYELLAVFTPNYPHLSDRIMLSSQDGMKITLSLSILVQATQEEQIISNDGLAGYRLSSKVDEFVYVSQ